MGVKKVRLDKFLSDHTELTRSQIKKKVAAGLVGVNGVIIKDAGFKVAFAGGNYKATRNSNKYAIPRYAIYDNISLDTFISYIS